MKSCSTIGENEVPIIILSALCNRYLYTVTSSKMLMPKKNRVAIYEALFKDGVLVAEKKMSMDKHSETEVPNLHVVKAMMVCIFF